MKTLNQFPEEDFAQLYKGIHSGRLYPTEILQKFWAFFFVSAVSIYFAMQVSQYNISKQFYYSWMPLFDGEWIILIAFAGLTLIFWPKRMRIKFQKAEFLLFILIVLKMTLDFQLVGLVLLKAAYPLLSFPAMLIGYLCAMILLFLLALVWGYHCIQCGRCREEGSGLFWKRGSEGSNRKRFMWILPFAAVGAILGRFLANNSSLQFMAIIMGLVTVILSLIMFGIALMEYLLIFYCKLRFSSFNPIRLPNEDAKMQGEYPTDYSK